MELSAGPREVVAHLRTAWRTPQSPRIDDPLRARPLARTALRIIVDNMLKCSRQKLQQVMGYTSYSTYEASDITIVCVLCARVAVA